MDIEKTAIQAVMDGEKIAMEAKVEVIEAACGICALSEGELLKRLEELWFKGFMAGKGAIEPMLQSVASELSKIVIAHMSGDKERLQAALEAFAKRHVKVVAPGASKSTVTH